MLGPLRGHWPEVVRLGLREDEVIDFSLDWDPDGLAGDAAVEPIRGGQRAVPDHLALQTPTVCSPVPEILGVGRVTLGIYGRRLPIRARK